MRNTCAPSLSTAVALLLLATLASGASNKFTIKTLVGSGVKMSSVGQEETRMLTKRDEGTSHFGSTVFTTNGNSYVEIILDGGTIVRVGEGTEFTFQWTGLGELGNMYIENGQMFAYFEGGGSAGTPTFNARLKGTSIMMSYDKKAGGVKLLVLEGKVTSRKEKGLLRAIHPDGSNSVHLGPGQMIVAHRDKDLPKKARHFSVEAIMATSNLVGTNSKFPPLPDKVLAKIQRTIKSQRRDFAAVRGVSGAANDSLTQGGRTGVVDTTNDRVRGERDRDREDNVPPKPCPPEKERPKKERPKKERPKIKEPRKLEHPKQMRPKREHIERERRKKDDERDHDRKSRRRESHHDD